jgi:DnaK suppressor protein
LKEVDVTAAKKAATTPKKVAPGAAKGGTATKKAAPKKAAVIKKSAPAAKKAAVKKVAPAKKKAPAPKKAAVKKAPPAKAVAAPPKKAAPVATNFKRTAPAPTPPKRPAVGPYAKEAKFLDEQRALLLEERAVYEGQAVDLRAEADSLALEREPGDVQFDEESGEGGTVTVDRERNLALSAQAGAAVEEIDDALRKIDRKFYGACERCYQPIPKARLRALPFARLCVACKSGGLSRR